MKPLYQIVERKDSQGFVGYLAKNGQLLLPLKELPETTRLAVDELLDSLGRASIARDSAAAWATAARKMVLGKPFSDF